MPNTSHDTDQRVPAPWLAEVEGRVWAMRPEALSALHSLARQGVSLEAARAEAQDAGLLAARRGTQRAAGGAVAVVPLHGVLTPSVSLLSLLFGMGGGLPLFRSALRDALNDDTVSSIVIDVDSPGGLVDLIPEVGAEVRAAREQKPIVAIANTLAASAAYWIASQADEVTVTPSGEAGSIGVYAAHKNMAGFYEQMGVEVTLISAGRYKVEGHPYGPIDDVARDALQQSVDDYYGLFVNAVAAGRGVKAADVRAGYGEGRTLTAKRAVQVGLADRVATLEETVARAASGRVARRAARAAAEADAGAEQQQQQEEHGAEAHAGAADEVTYTPEDRERILHALR